MNKYSEALQYINESDDNSLTFVGNCIFDKSNLVGCIQEEKHFNTFFDVVNTYKHGAYYATLVIMYANILASLSDAQIEAYKLTFKD